jgi:hypothetical protein
MFYDSYGVFEIDPKGIDPKAVFPDQVGEFCAPWHRIIRQDSIEAKFLKLVGRFDVTASGVEAFYRWYHFFRWGMTEEQYDAMLEEQREASQLIKKLRLHGEKLPGRAGTLDKE